MLLEDRRLKKNLSQLQVALRLGVTIDKIKYIETADKIHTNDGYPLAREEFYFGEKLHKFYDEV